VKWIGPNGAPREARMIHIRRIAEGDPLEFEVIVRDGQGETSHRVSFSRALHRQLAGQHSPERCLDAAFRFLLDREPKESILRRFDVGVIGQYFPEFARELPKYLAQG
jgi:hypothetical protein